MKKRILFVYTEMAIGGSTTSLLSILNSLDYDKYEVDLLLRRNHGDLLEYLPPQVRLLPPALKYPSYRGDYIRRMLSPRYLWHYYKAKCIVNQSGIPIHGAQYIESQDVDFYRKISGKYDVAIAFLEGVACKLVANHISAQRRIAWIHVNYRDAKFNPDFDRDAMVAFDKIVLVSEDCKSDFDKIFPELQARTCVIENILTSELIQSRSKEDVGYQIQPDDINLVTTCRINFRSKGLDRVVGAMKRLWNDGLGKNLHWHIIGDGCDLEQLKKMVADANLENNIHCIGMKKNPYPYMAGMTLFFLPSRWEGKPMAVTEAFMLGLPALVTEYSSAREQVQHDIDGFIVENSEDGIYEGLRMISEHPEIIERWRKNVCAKDYSNVHEMKKVVAVIEGDERANK